jgi:hypothetical protein
MDKDPEALSDAKRLLKEWAKDRRSRTGSCLSLRRMQFSFSTVSLVNKKEARNANSYLSGKSHQT